MDALERILRKPLPDRSDIITLLSLAGEGEIERLRSAAYDLATTFSGGRVHYRGIVEFSNICARNCLYCGLRRDNRRVERYCLPGSEIVAAALWCAEAGFGSCVLQSGERRDRAFTRLVENCVAGIKRGSRCAALPRGLGITLSVGEQSPAAYRRFFAAGAHRYLLRIETTNRDLFARLHPHGQGFEARLACLDSLRGIGYQVGTGVMIGLPGQTTADLADDILFFAARDIDMIGMGPYLPHHGSPLETAGMTAAPELLSLSLKMISVARLVLRDVNIAATTALQVLAADGRERGILHGANVVMPNVTPRAVREKYLIYEGKPCLDEEREACRDCLARRVAAAGRSVGWNEWGDSPRFAARVRSGAVSGRVQGRCSGLLPPREGGTREKTRDFHDAPQRGRGGEKWESKSPETST